MDYPRIFKSPNLTRVFDPSHADGTRRWQEKVNEVFGMTIAIQVEKATSASSCLVHPLELDVLEELSNILRLSKSNWKFWTIELIEKTIPKLVEACLWKNQILSEKAYYRDVVKKLSDDGIRLLSGLPEYLDRFSKDKKQSTRRHLVNRYLEPPFADGDSSAILTRALRCFITYRITKKPKSELLFRFCTDLRISLWSKHIEKYLYEQLCLYIYLFRNPEEAHFFLERKQQLINFVSARLPQSSEDLAEMIVGESFDYLIKRRNTYAQTPDEIWLDTSLDTFFIGKILSSKRIQRIKEKHRKLEGEHLLSDDDYDESNISVRSKYHYTPEYATTSNADNEKSKLLRQYVSRLDTTCKSYFQWEYFGRPPKGNELPELKQVKAVAQPCLDKMRTLLLNNGYYDLFIK